jgi:hypothetical protein
VLTLHIGLPKTGTTYLQRNVWPKAPELLLVHRRQGPQAEKICMDLRHYVRANALVAALLRRRIRRALRREDARAAAERRMLLVSAENISVHPIAFWRGADPEPEHVARRLADLARSAGRPLSPVRVIVGIRQQDQWLASRYAESGKDLPELSQADFDRRLSEIVRARDLAGGLAWLDHARVHAAFAAALGANNVHVYRLEEIGSDPAGTVERMGRFIGGEALGAALRRIAAEERPARRNVLSIGGNAWRLRSGRSRLHLRPELALAVQERFRASNAALEAALRERAGC